MNVISDYVFVDELLGSIIAQYFLPKKTPQPRGHKRRLRTFEQFVLEDLYLLRKLALVKELKKIDRNIAAMIERLNDIRNAMAHGFTPSERRNFRKSKKVTWNGLDIFSVAGMESYHEDIIAIYDHLFVKRFGKKMAKEVAGLRP